MNNIQKSILFLGDSFTWGEGLELYCNTPKWISERNNYNEWDQLYKIQDNDSINFRNSNRFAGLVGEYFGVKPIVGEKNGGNFSSYIDVAERALFNPDLYIDTIIIQFSQFNRNHLHLYPGCLCNFCVATDNMVPYSSMTVILDKLLNSEKITPHEEYILNYFEDKLNLKWNNPNFLIKLEMNTTRWYVASLEEFIRTYIKKWESYGKRKIFYINSWDPSVGHIIKNNAFICKNMINLIGSDEKKYTSWDKWASTFKHKSIVDEFPKTLNHHPTLDQHKFLASSIIQHLIKNNYE